MKSVKLIALALVLLVGLFLTTQVVSAHQTVTVGDYAVEYGWVSEPAVVGQPNAFVVNLSLASAPVGSQPQDVDVSALIVQVVYGDQSKVLTLQPLGENTPGQFIAPITPMVAGTYTLHLGGKIGSTDFNNDVQPEEVKTADIVQFPAIVPAKAAAGLPLWAGILGILLGAAGTVLGALALVRKPR